MKYELKRVSGHLGKIFTNISVVSLIVTAIALMVPAVMVIPILLYIVFVAISVCSIIPMLIDGYRDLVFTKIPDTLFVDNTLELLNKMSILIPIAGAISIASTVIATVCLIIDIRNKESAKKLGIIGIAVVIFLAGVMVASINGGFYE